MAKKSSAALVNASLGIRLSSHEKLCAERMKQLIKAIDELNKKVSKLSDDVSRGKGAVAVLVGIGTIIAACIGFFNFR
jgi:hypothetical protein|tara:strand:+ start:1131 stop:1364 length:234 start_codon:yes stop_codon:yes gene_type:complete